MDNNWDTSCEPMDVDLSSNSAMEVSYTDHCVTSCIQDQDLQKNVAFNDDNKEELLIIRKCERESIIKDNIDNKWSHSSINYVILSPLLILIMSFVFISTFNFNCHEEVNLTLLKDTFRSKIFGQTRAIENFVKALEVKHDTKLVILYGGTGVGKTFTVSLLLNNIVNFTNIYHYTAFAQTFSSEPMFGFLLCKSSIIIIDDIDINDTEIKTKVEEIILKSRNLHKLLTIILIYNCGSNKNLKKSCDSNFVSKLEYTFSDMPVYRSLVKFEPLSEESLLKCIQNEIMKKLSATDLVRIMKNFNVHLDGCKGVHQKMKYFNYV